MTVSNNTVIRAFGNNAGIEVPAEVLDTAPPEVAVPPELAAALGEAGLVEAFGKLAPSRRKEYVRQVSDAKSDQTRDRRLTKILTELR